MEGNMVSAAKWFGISLIISSVILVVGFNMTMNKVSRKITAGLMAAGSNARPHVPHVSVPSQLRVNLSPGGSFNVNLGNKDNAEFDIRQK